MSIYATLWKLKFPTHGDDYPGCEWITVIAQGVPAHIGSPTPTGGNEAGDPFVAFLPPALSVNAQGESEYVGGVGLVKEGMNKGTNRSPQEYVEPLLVLTGEEYAHSTFDTLYARICKALRGNRPRVVATSLVAGRHMRIRFEDGTDREIDWPSDGNH